MECQEAYNPYPNALLSMRFIIEVSKIILADAVVDPGEVKEGDSMPDAPKHDMERLETVSWRESDGGSPLSFCSSFFWTVESFVKV